MPSLSPQAQAVLDAVVFSKPGLYSGIAAALRAAADRVVPGAETNRSPCREGCVIGAAPERIRAELLAIATELENLSE